MASLSIQAFRQTVTVAWPKKQDADAKQHLINVARKGHARIMADAQARGLDPQWEAYANTPGNSNLDSVKLPGPIVYKYRYVGDIVQTALLMLQKASPVRSGRYAKSHTIFVNGAPVAQAPKVLRHGESVMIANPVPYARRLEIGKTEKGRDFIIQVPNRIYERVAKALVSKYRNLASITFGYVSLPGAYATKGMMKSHYISARGHRRRRRQKAGAQVQSPAIFFEAKT